MHARSAAVSAVILLAAGPAVLGYVRLSYNGKALWRGSQIRFVVDPKVAPGLKNSDGAVVLTPESDPVAALRAAMRTWSTVPAATVNLDLTVSPAAGPGRDFINTISFDDTASSRSLTSSAIAVTVTTYRSDGVIVDSDIVFNPALEYATTPTLGCFDLQSIATHELGHALGAGHSVLSSATMFAYTDTEETRPRHLSSDDIAFVSDAFPAGGPLGGVFGWLQSSSGGAVSGALVLVIDPATGFVVAPYAAGTAYSTGGLPPGNYIVAALPVAPYLTGDPSGAGTPDWQASFYGGAAPQTITVGAGQLARADITIPDGPAQLTMEFGDFGGGYGPAGSIPSGGPAEIRVYGRGFSDAIRPEDIVFYGSGVSVRTDSVHIVASPGPTVLGMLSFTADIAPRTDWADAVMTVQNDASVAIYSGLRILPSGPQLTPSGIVNAASFAPGAVAPGEIVSLFGSGFGPDDPLAGMLDGSGKLVTSLGNTDVEFDGQPAPLFYVSSTQINAQVPFEIAPQASTRVRIRNNDALSEVIMPVAAASPAIFRVVNQDGSMNDASRPASPASIVVAYGTGQGTLDPPLATGATAPVAPLCTAQVSASVGELPARVDFAGAAPGFIGLLQVNIAIPDAAPSGYLPLKLTVNGGFNSNPMYIFVE